MYFYFSLPKTAKGVTINYDTEAKGADWTNVAIDPVYWAGVIENSYLPFFAPYSKIVTPEQLIREGVVAAQIRDIPTAQGGAFLNSWRDYRLMKLGATADQLPDGAQSGTGLYDPNGPFAAKIQAVEAEAALREIPIYRNGYLAAGVILGVTVLTIWGVRKMLKKGKK